MQHDSTDDVTCNACADISAGAWFQPLPQHGPELVCRKEHRERIRSILSSMQFVWPPSFRFRPRLWSYLFYGPPDTGKTYLAHALAHDLMTECGFSFLSLSAEDLRSCSENQRRELPSAAFRAALDRSPCVILVEDLEQFCADRGAPDQTRANVIAAIEFLRAYRELYDAETTMIFIGCTNAPQMLDPALRYKLHEVRFPYPDRDSRQTFFSQHLGDLPFDADLSEIQLASVTENRDFRELTQLAEALSSKAQGRPLSRAMLEEALKEHPCADKTDILQALKAFEAPYRD